MSGEGMSIDMAPFFNGTGFPRWKVLMQAHLQARGLDVWPVTELGMKNENKELKIKYESLESKNESSSDKLFPCNIPCAIPINKVDASTSCDLTPCNEDVIIETCDDLIAKENDELKQEVCNTLI